jgi:tellurite resistance protein
MSDFIGNVQNDVKTNNEVTQPKMVMPKTFEGEIVQRALMKILDDHVARTRVSRNFVVTATTVDVGDGEKSDD